MLDNIEKSELLERLRLRTLIVDRLRLSDILDLKTKTLKEIWELLNVGGNNET